MFLINIKRIFNSTNFDNIPADEIKKIILELNENIPCQLQWLSWLFIMIYFCRRGQENLNNLKKSDLIQKEVQGKKIIQMKNEATKNHSESNEDINNGGAIVEMLESGKCPVKILNKYLSKLSDSPWLWQQPANAYLDEDPVWFKKKNLE